MAEKASLRDRLAACYMAACREEVEAPKPGNVHVFAGGHGMVFQQFLASAEVSAGPLTHPGWPVGRRILEAIRATRRAVGVNTNLGIVLLCGPLLAAAERCVSFDPPPKTLRSQLASVLQSLDMTDARDVFTAIAHADPGGLGEAEDDVRSPPRVGLLEAMRQASGRDMIARQYADGFAAIFDVGLAELDAARGRGDTAAWQCVAAYLRFVLTFPDSHVARKFGVEAAELLSGQAAALREKLAATREKEDRLELLLAADADLKSRNLNPGTSADLTVASLLVRNLRDNLHIRMDDA